MAQRNTSRKPRSSGASRRGGANKGGVPGWVWLVTGLLVGLFVAFLVLLARFDSPSPYPSAEKGKAGKESSAGKAQNSAAKENRAAGATDTARNNAKPPSAKEKVTDTNAKPAASVTQAEEPKDKPAVNYDFYKILPQYEVVVTEEEARKPSGTTASTPGTYYLQVGAFRQMQEADSRKAGLAMLGIVSSIQTVTIDPGNTWHRVRIGPVKDMRELDRTKRQLQENSIAFVTLKEKS